MKINKYTLMFCCLGIGALALMGVLINPEIDGVPMLAVACGLSAIAISIED